MGVFVEVGVGGSLRYWVVWILFSVVFVLCVSVVCANGRHDGGLPCAQP